jgi:deazaflavin-dependent oxidoreductase (nitroreductase family)
MEEDMNDWQQRNQPVIDQFRANNGNVKGWGQIMLITMTGAKSGKEYIIPLMRVDDGDRLLAVASKGGAPEHPDWYYNLRANPEVTVEIPNETYKARARELAGEERQKAFVRSAEVFPPYASYQQKTEREIPIFALERIVE